jgi:hypothetical protein
VSKARLVLNTRHVPPQPKLATATLGIDLASQPLHTAACIVEWSSPRATVVSFHAGPDDDQLLALLDDTAVTKAGIDAPFGWPQAFVEAVHAYADRGEWPAGEPRSLTLRETDLRVRDETGTDPLSVSASFLSYPAMRCARLLTEYGRQWGPVDRCGAGRIVEVYPAAALRQWGLNPRGYKGSKPEQAARRSALIDEIARGTGRWLLLSDSDVAACAQSDHLLDALLASIVARAAEVGHDLPIPGESLDRACREGGIALPRRGGLSALELTGC